MVSKFLMKPFINQEHSEKVDHKIHLLRQFGKKTCDFGRGGIRGAGERVLGWMPSRLDTGR